MMKLLQYWVSNQAEQRPDATALVFNQERMTYRTLDEASSQLARLLKTTGCVRGDRACILIPKSIPAIVAILGTLKADCIYVPMDTASPAIRLSRIIELCKSRCVLATRSVGPLLNEIMSNERLRQSVRVGWLESGTPTGYGFNIEFSWDDLASNSAGPVSCMNTSDSTAHILFTSGSTGTPKGVQITHSNVIHFIEWAIKYFETSPTDRISSHPPLHFDLSTFDMFGTFAAGAELHLVPPEMSLLPHKLADFIRNSRLTQWFSVPSVLNYMAKFDVVKPNDFPSLKRLLWCGEKFPTPGLIYWMKRLPNVTFTNLYGPTETTIASSYYRVSACPQDEKSEVPIGVACEGEELLVLDERLEPVNPGEIGDLYIRGVGLSPGYWKDPEKTSSVFLKNPRSTDHSDRIYKTGDLARMGTDGLIYLLGRVDSQIKSRGYRIELGEIEAALNAIEGIRECAVVATETDGFEGTAICCAYVLSPGIEMPPVALRKRLAEALPPYMLPSQWMALEALPLNANGKTDRPQLRRQFVEGGGFKSATS